jgi:hypothetical protein
LLPVVKQQSLGGLILSDTVLFRLDCFPLLQSGRAASASSQREHMRGLRETYAL